MNYLVLNGKNSRYIQGLLIQELPPVSKPLMRTQIEEIDGRDGDIITDLGFQSYDRPCKIALTRNYDIDDVIDYFNFEGEVIFSNEPYLKYKAKVIQKIDFERLIRFRTATVNFHCQPFKHSTIETPLTFDDLTENDSFVDVINTGNYKSRPKLTIYGAGAITLGVGSQTIFSIALGTEGNITIDTETLEAYKGTTLKNRIVSGNYDNFFLEKGLNEIFWTGNVTKIVIENYSRWL